jgi:hypothetical protein
MASSSDDGRVVAARNSAMESGSSVVKNAGTAPSAGSSSTSNGGWARAVVSILQFSITATLAGSGDQSLPGWILIVVEHVVRVVLLLDHRVGCCYRNMINYRPTPLKFVEPKAGQKIRSTGNRKAWDDAL